MTIDTEQDTASLLLEGAPRPLLSRRAEGDLGDRHREVLDQLETLFLARGFAAFTVRELASGVGCSRRTLYELAPSKGDLVLLVLDRFLHRIGRSALSAIDHNAPVIEQVRQYVTGGIELQRRTAAFAEDLADEPAARRLLERHFRYVTRVVERLVALGMDRGEVRDVDPAVAAAAIAGSVLALTRADVAATIALDGEQFVDSLLDFLLRSLEP